MKKARKKRESKMRSDYDLSNGTRGKYAERFAEGTNMVLLAADVAQAFPDSESVNEALRALMAIARKSVKKAVS